MSIISISRSSRFWFFLYSFLERRVSFVRLHHLHLPCAPTRHMLVIRSPDNPQPPPQRKTINKQPPISDRSPSSVPPKTSYFMVTFRDMKVPWRKHLLVSCIVLIALFAYTIPTVRAAPGDPAPEEEAPKKKPAVEDDAPLLNKEPAAEDEAPLGKKKPAAGGEEEAPLDKKPALGGEDEAPGLLKKPGAEEEAPLGKKAGPADEDDGSTLLKPTGGGLDAGAGGGLDGGDGSLAPPPEAETCNGIFLGYAFMSREKEYPHVKNASAQAWAFKSTLTVLNTGTDELKGWKVHVKFQYDEILVSASGAVLVDAMDFPARVGKNGTTFAGYPMVDLKTAIDTAGDLTQMQALVEISGTQFGLKKGTPMPKTIKLANDGYKCPAPKKRATSMNVCCKKDPKFKKKVVKTKFLHRQYGDLTMTYDVLQAYESSYQAQVTIENNHPLGRLDHWNLTWEWMRGEFIYDMKGAYTHKKDFSECIYGPQGQYYGKLDFSQVMNCERKPVIADLPREKAKDEKIGNVPYCCRNGTILPKVMNVSESRSVFKLQVFKMPPDMNRTAISPPQKWKIYGILNPKYVCGPPIRVDPTEFPDPTGLNARTQAIASFQVSCNITKPKPKEAKCCVSFSAYYADSAIPCNTCACGCEDDEKCNPNAKALLIPPEALLVPFANRTAKAAAWAKIKHLGPVKTPLPCPDNCGVSLNWHLDTDFKSGWTARITLFNWREYAFEDWFAAVEMKKAFPGYENVYSFNGTKLPNQKTIFFQGLPGLNYLVGETNGTRPRDIRVPGKQQSVISFLKNAHTHGMDVAGGDGFPTKVIFNGEECAIPTRLPKKSSAGKVKFSFLTAVFAAIVTFLLITDRFH